MLPDIPFPLHLIQPQQLVEVVAIVLHCKRLFGYDMKQWAKINMVQTSASDGRHVLGLRRMSPRTMHGFPGISTPDLTK